MTFKDQQQCFVQPASSFWNHLKIWENLHCWNNLWILPPHHVCGCICFHVRKWSTVTHFLPFLLNDFTRRGVWLHRGAIWRNLSLRDGEIRSPRLVASSLVASYVNRLLCSSANQPLIPALAPMWEVMLHASLSFSHQCLLCLCHYLPLPLHVCLRECCRSVIGPLFCLASGAGPLGLFT